MRRYLLVATLVGAAFVFCLDLIRQCLRTFAWDFAINITAALAFRLGLPIYDPSVLHTLGVTRVSERLEASFTTPFSSYIGPPTTALLLVPLSLLPFSFALALYRLCCLGAFIAALALTSRSLPAPSRARGVIWGGFALLLWDAPRVSLAVGQVDAFIMLALAVSIYGMVRERRWLTGAGVGIAALLKISPLVVLLTFGLQRRYRALLAATLVVITLLGVAVGAGGSENMYAFATHVAPTLADGTTYLENQSLPAYVARLVENSRDVTSYGSGLGIYRWLGILVLVSGSGLAYWLGRRWPDHPLVVSIALLAGLLAGPIMWGHYASWAVLALIPMADQRLWEGRTVWGRYALGALLVVGFILIGLPLPLGDVIPAPIITASRWHQILTGTRTIGLLLWLGVGCWLGLIGPVREQQPVLV